MPKKNRVVFNPHKELNSKERFDLVMIRNLMRGTPLTTVEQNRFDEIPDQAWDTERFIQLRKIAEQDLKEQNIEIKNRKYLYRDGNQIEEEPVEEDLKEEDPKEEEEDEEIDPNDPVNFLGGKGDLPHDQQLAFDLALARCVHLQKELNAQQEERYNDVLFDYDEVKSEYWRNLKNQVKNEINTAIIPPSGAKGNLPAEEQRVFDKKIIEKKRRHRMLSLEEQERDNKVIWDEEDENEYWTGIEKEVKLELTAEKEDRKKKLLALKKGVLNAGGNKNNNHAENNIINNEEENRIPNQAEDNPQRAFDMGIIRKLISDNELSEDEVKRFNEVNFNAIADGFDEAGSAYWNGIFESLRQEMGADVVNGFLDGIEIAPKGEALENNPQQMNNPLQNNINFIPPQNDKNNIGNDDININNDNIIIGNDDNNINNENNINIINNINNINRINIKERSESLDSASFDQMIDKGNNDLSGGEDKEKVDDIIKINIGEVDPTEAYFELGADNKVSPEKLADFTKKLRLPSPSEEEQKLFEQHKNVLNPNKEKDDAFNHIFSHTDPNRVDVFFKMYLMANKDMSFTDAIHFLPGKEGYEDTMEEFHRFLEEHPIDPDFAESQETAEENAKVWADLFMDCADKFREYKIPDIDYLDPNAVNAHAFELNQLALMQINFTQEFETVFDSGRRKFAIDAAGSERKLNERLEPVIQLQSFVTLYKEVYQVEPKALFENACQINGDEYCELYANKRLYFGSILGEKQRGKSLDEICKDKSVDTLLTLTEYTDIPPMPFGAGNAKKLILDGTYSSYRNREIQLIAESRDVARRKYNTVQQFEAAKDFGRKLFYFRRDLKRTSPAVQAKKVSMKFVFDSLDDPEKFVQRLNDPQSEEFRGEMKNFFGSIMSGATRPYFYDLMKINEPMSIVRIDGKTPQELWGNLTENMTTSEKEAYYQARIAKEALYGDKNITVDAYYADSKMNMKPVPISAILSDAEAQRKTAFLKNIQDIHEKLIRYQRTLEATGTHASEVYVPFKQALDDCIDASDVLEGSGSVVTFIEKMNTLQQTARTYYKARGTGFSGLFSAYWQNGRTRRDTAKELMNDLPYELEKLKDIYPLSELKLDRENLLVDENRESYYHFDTIWKEIKNNHEIHGKPLPEDVNDTLWRGNDEVQAVLVEAHEKSKLRRIVNQASKRMTKDEILDENLSDLFEPNEQQEMFKLARKIVKVDYLIKLREAGKPYALSVKELKNEIESPDFEKECREKAMEITRNPDFIDYFRENPETCEQKWFKKVREEKAEKHKALSKNNPVYRKNKKRFPDHFEDRWEAAEHRLNRWIHDWGDLKKQTNDLYEKHKESMGLVIPYELAVKNKKLDPDTNKARIERETFNGSRNTLYEAFSDILTKAVLVDAAKKGNPYAINIAMKPEKVKDMRKHIESCLREEQAFENLVTTYETMQYFDLTLKRARGYFQTFNPNKINRMTNDYEITGDPVIRGQEVKLTRKEIINEKLNNINNINNIDDTNNIFNSNNIDNINNINNIDNLSRSNSFNNINNINDDDASIIMDKRMNILNESIKSADSMDSDQSILLHPVSHAINEVNKDPRKMNQPKPAKHNKNQPKKKNPDDSKLNESRNSIHF